MNEVLFLDVLRALRAISPRLVVFFRNQQRFLHLYLLARGERVTTAYIEAVVQALDPTRSFSPQTYYGLRQELHEGGWIAQDTTPGRAENPHFIVPARMQAFVAWMSASSVVERPVDLDKLHLFDLGLLLARMQREPSLPASEIEQELRTLQNQQPDADIYYPDYMLHGLAGSLAARAVRLERKVTDMALLAPRLVAAPAPAVLSRARSRVRERAGARRNLPESRAAFAPAAGHFAETENPIPPPSAKDCAVLITLHRDSHGDFRLKCTVAGGALAKAQVFYRLASATGEAELLAHDGRSCDTKLPSGTLWRALDDLTISIVSAAQPPAVFTLAMHAAPDDGPVTLTVQSTGTGLSGVEVHYQLGGLRPTLLREALEAALAIEDEPERMDALAGLAPHLTEELWTKAQDTAGEIASLPHAQAGEGDLWTVTTQMHPPAAIRQAADAFYVWLGTAPSPSAE